MEYLLNRHQELEEKFHKLSDEHESPCLSFPTAEHVTSNKELNEPSCPVHVESPTKSDCETSYECFDGYDSSITCVRCMKHSQNQKNRNVFSSFGSNKFSTSFATHCIGSSESPWSSISFIPSLRSHHVLDNKVEAISPKGDLWQKLEAQFQEERRQAGAELGQAQP